MKEALLKVVLVFLCATAWGCWLPAVEGGDVVDVAAPRNPPRRFKFTTDEATGDSYMEFIQALRITLWADQIHDIPVLPDPATIPENDRYVVVELSNTAGQSIEIGIDRTNVYVVAYRVGGESYFLNDAPESASNHLFTDTTGSTLRFGGSYRDILNAGQQNMVDASLGWQNLEQAITSLFRVRDNDRERARSLLTIIMMVSEAVRYNNIEERVADSISRYESFRIPLIIDSMVNAWGSLSSNIQQSLQGTFPYQVPLFDETDTRVIVDSLLHPLVVYVALMQFVCRPNPKTLIIRSIVEPPAAEEKGTCDIYEPTVQIRGRDGLCMDLSGKDVVLWTCKNQLNDNQLWTLKTDLTIRSRSGGKCLTTSGATEGSYVIISDCGNAVGRLSTWEIQDNGDIHSKTFLALTAPSKGMGGKLTIEEIGYKLPQGWRAGNDTSALVTMIYGYKGLCMDGDVPTVWVTNCSSTSKKQRWALYSDGSIRPVLNTSLCLTSYSHDEGAKIIFGECRNGWASQRYVFSRDGTIFNPSTVMVMGVKNSDPSLKQIVISPRNEDDDSHQVWRIMF